MAGQRWRTALLLTRVGGHGCPVEQRPRGVTCITSPPSPAARDHAVSQGPPDSPDRWGRSLARRPRCCRSDHVGGPSGGHLCCEWTGAHWRLSSLAGTVRTAAGNVQPPGRCWHTSLGGTLAGRVPAPDPSCGLGSGADPGPAEVRIDASGSRAPRRGRVTAAMPGRSARPGGIRFSGITPCQRHPEKFRAIRLARVAAAS
jgi:hypothetical protein